MTILQRSVNKAKGMGVGMGSRGNKKALNFILKKKKKKDGVKQKFQRESDLLALKSRTLSFSVVQKTLLWT